MLEDYTVESIQTVMSSQPKKPVRSLCQPCHRTRRAVFRTPRGMRELGYAPIAVKRGSTRACKREEKADLQRSYARTAPPKSSTKKSRLHPCVSELRFPKKVRSISRAVGVYSLLILTFLEQQLGNINRNSLAGLRELRHSDRRGTRDPPATYRCTMRT